MASIDDPVFVEHLQEADILVFHKDENGRWHVGTDTGGGPDCSFCPRGEGTYDSLAEALRVLLSVAESALV